MFGMRVPALFLALVSAAACGEKKEKESAPVSPPATSPEDSFTEVDKVALMEQHYTAAIVAHDMLIRGNLEEFREVVSSINGTLYLEVLRKGRDYVVRVD